MFATGNSGFGFQLDNKRDETLVCVSHMRLRGARVGGQRARYDIRLKCQARRDRIHTPPR